MPKSFDLSNKIFDRARTVVFNAIATVFDEHLFRFLEIKEVNEN